jgi:hypothetical protein
MDPEELHVISDETCVASIPLWSDEDGHEGDELRAQSLGNALLVAAAPEIVEALHDQTEAARAVIDSWAQGDLAGAVRGLEACMRASRQALAKASFGDLLIL